MPAADIRVLILSEFYPHVAQPQEGIFVREQLRHLNGCEVVSVMAPAVVYPPLPRYRRLRALQSAAGRQREEERLVLRLRVPHVPWLSEAVAVAAWHRQAVAAIKRYDLRFDLIHAHWAYRSGWVATQLAREFSRPCVITAQGSDIAVWRHERRKRRRLLAALQQAQVIIALNPHMRANLLAEGVAAEKVIVIPQGVDCGRFQPVAGVRAGWLPANFQSQFVLLCVANHHHVKGVDVLLHALAQSHPSIALVLVGGGPETRRLEALSKSLALSSRVWFAGVQPPETIPQWINAADVVVIPSRSEGGPAILLEALACGKPVVATATGMAPAVLTDEQIGLLTPVADVQSLARALERAREQHWDAERLRQHALPYRWEEIGRRIVAVYHHVLRRE